MTHPMDKNRPDTILTPVADYYTSKLGEFGAQPRGVDWNGIEGQTLRFKQLCKVIPGGEPFSIVDIGCGYGALLDFLLAHYDACHYTGVDISAAMIEAARARYEGQIHAVFVNGTSVDETVDFAVASGIFNVKLGANADLWHQSILNTLDDMNRVSRKGFAFNCLTSYSDEDRKRADLYYADPVVLFDHCKRNYSRNVALLHDYDLYEFTMVVRK
jgi:SAM-dependent methyltransferase